MAGAAELKRIRIRAERRVPRRSGHIVLCPDQRVVLKLLTERDEGEPGLSPRTVAHILRVRGGTGVDWSWPIAKLRWLCRNGLAAQAGEDQWREPTFVATQRGRNLIGRPTEARPRSSRAHQKEYNS